MLPRPVTTSIVYWYPLVKVNAEPWRAHCGQLEPMLNGVVVTLFGASDGPLQFANAYSLLLESLT
jgi:hypothetical protein